MQSHSPAHCCKTSRELLERDPHIDHNNFDSSSHLSKCGVCKSGYMQKCGDHRRWSHLDTLVFEFDESLVVPSSGERSHHAHLLNPIIAEECSSIAHSGRHVKDLGDAPLDLDVVSPFDSLSWRRDVAVAPSRQKFAENTLVAV